ncbi:MAG: ABC transporter ATP-binding protein [Rhodospirillales bacterium]|nr:ABC transporter ATP-binding protein [Rhodospirillales bacterium]
MSDLLALEGIAAGYGSIQALSGVSLRVTTGTIVALLGSNGAGKTTTLNTISRVVPLTGGRILFDGEPIHELPSSRVVMRGISQVPEGREIFARMSVEENLVIGAHVRRDRAGIAADLERVCDYFPVLKSRFRQMAGTLSGGEQQMLLIARALMARPRILLLDEPSLGLSPIMVQQIFKIIRRLNEDGLTVLLVEQNARLALAVSQYAYVMENGEIRFEGRSADLVKDDGLRRTYLGV